MRVVALNVHPVKSCAIRPVSSAVVERAGFAGDRRWMVVDAEGRLVSARELHRLFTVVPDTAQTSTEVAQGIITALGQLDVKVPIVVRLDVQLARRKMGVGEFAEAVGLTPANVAVLKNGRAKAVRFSTLEAMCRVLECQPGDLLEWEAE